MELVDMSDLGSDAARCGSSSLPARTKAEDFSSAFFIKKTVEKNVRYNIGTTFCYFEDNILIDIKSFHLSFIFMNYQLE